MHIELQIYGIRNLRDACPFSLHLGAGTMNELRANGQRSCHLI